MSVKLFIGGLSWTTDESSLRAAFAPFGEIEAVTVIREPETQKSKGFGFVTYTTQPDAAAAIDGMNGAELDGRSIRVDMAGQPPSKINTNGVVGEGRGRGPASTGAGGSFSSNNWRQRDPTLPVSPTTSGWGGGAAKSARGAGPDRNW